MYVITSRDQKELAKECRDRIRVTFRGAIFCLGLAGGLFARV